MNPQMLMQVMQMDPRFMDVFTALTGVDLSKMKGDAGKTEEMSEDMEKVAAENKAKYEA